MYIRELFNGWKFSLRGKFRWCLRQTVVGTSEVFWVVRSLFYLIYCWSDFLKKIVGHPGWNIYWHFVKKLLKVFQFLVFYRIKIENILIFLEYIGIYESEWDKNWFGWRFCMVGTSLQLGVPVRILWHFLTRTRDSRRWRSWIWKSQNIFWG